MQRELEDSNSREFCSAPLPLTLCAWAPCPPFGPHPFSSLHGDVAPGPKGPLLSLLLCPQRPVPDSQPGVWTPGPARPQRDLSTTGSHELEALITLPSTPSPMCSAREDPESFCPPPATKDPALESVTWHQQPTAKPAPRQCHVARRSERHRRLTSQSPRACLVQPGLLGDRS